MERPPVTRCPVPLRAKALGSLQAANRTEQQEALARTVDALDGEPDSAWDGLLICGDNSNPSSALHAIWVQRAAGNTAIVWAPPPECPVATDLFAAASRFVDQQRFALAQLIVAEDERYSPQLIEGGGFPHLADLLYLFTETDAESAAPVRDSDTSFFPRAGDDPTRLARLIEHTYRETLDCPSLDGVRSIDDVLAGYRTQGEFLPDHWYFVQSGNRDVGALLLASHPESQNWELVYMGVIPEARGRALGKHVVDFAIVAANRGGAQRLVLAVDAHNKPAVAMYLRAGFVEWDRRIVYARLAAPAKSNARQPA